jgi:hypothetical protein
VGVERNIGHLRKYLGQNAKQQGLHPACSSGLNRLNGLYIDGFYGFGKKFANHTTECKPKANTPGNAPKPTAATKRIPRMSSGIERKPFRITRAG